ncbi:MAG: universal stress protein [Chloroflexota bacterium]
MRILVPLDGSGLARPAIAAAKTVITRRGGQIILLHAHWPGIPTDPADAVMEEEIQTLRRDGIDATAERRATPRDEETGRVIADAARECGADVIAMTTHGRGGMGRWLFGSVTEQVIRCASTPIFLTPSMLAMDWPAGREAMVLVALDGSELAERSVAPATELARSIDAEIILVRILPVGKHGDDTNARNLLAAQEYLDGVAAPVRAQDINTRTLIRRGEPDQAITAIANELQVAAISLGIRGADASTRAALGSVAMGIIRRTDVPVLLA